MSSLTMAVERLPTRVLVCAAWSFAAACATSLPPFMRVSTGVQSEPHQAMLVILWPSTSCDTGGYYTLATADGKFLGNVSAGTQLHVALPAGEYTILGWNGAGGVMGAVPVLHATVAEGRTYYVHMEFGEWDQKGPRAMHVVRTGMRVCFEIGRVMSSAMVRLTPASVDWGELKTWTTELHPIAAEVAVGQAWLDENRDALTATRALAERRWSELRADARQLATLDAADGVPVPP
jgi:hypothetical protein